MQWLCYLGRIRPYDRLLSINGTDVRHCKISQASDLIKVGAGACGGRGAGVASQQRQRIGRGGDKLETWDFSLRRIKDIQINVPKLEHFIPYFPDNKL